jgi:hypothetical protein
MCVRELYSEARKIEGQVKPNDEVSASNSPPEKLAHEHVSTHQFQLQLRWEDFCLGDIQWTRDVTLQNGPIRAPEIIGKK